MDQSDKIGRVPFSDAQTAVISSLTTWMLVFIMFYLIIGVAYFILSINSFISGS